MDVHDIGWAVRQMRAGLLVRRVGWNGKKMFLFLVPETWTGAIPKPLKSVFREGTAMKFSAHVAMKTATGDIVPWLCSQTDLLAFDWEIAEGAAA